MGVLLQVRGVLVVEALDSPPFVPVVQALSVPQGSDLDVQISVIDSYGEAVDLSDCAVLLTVRHLVGDLDPLLSRLAVVTDAARGLCVCSFSTEETGDLVVQSDVYDVWLIQGSGLRSQVVPTSAFVVASAVAVPGDTPTIPLPSIAGQAGKFLSNDGTNLDWRTVVYLRARGAWTADGVYALNDVVQDAGATYRCLLAVGPSATHPGADSTHYELWAAKGDTGAATFGLTTVGASFVQPAVGAGVSVLFGSTVGMYAGMMLVIDDGTAFAGVYRVASVTDATHAVVVNLGLSAIAPTSTFAATRATVAGGRFYNLGPIGLVGASNGAGDFTAAGVKAGDVLLSIIDGDGGLFQKTVGPTAASDFRAGALADDTLHQFNGSNWSATPFVYGLLRFLF